jgi:hypothetical protein
MKKPSPFTDHQKTKIHQKIPIGDSNYTLLPTAQQLLQAKGRLRQENQQ